jgi:hypothetical protein
MPPDAEKIWLRNHWRNGRKESAAKGASERGLSGRGSAVAAVEPGIYSPGIREISELWMWLQPQHSDAKSQAQQGFR